MRETAQNTVMKRKRKKHGDAPVLPADPTRKVNYSGRTDDDRKFD